MVVGGLCRGGGEVVVVDDWRVGVRVDWGEVGKIAADVLKVR